MNDCRLSGISSAAIVAMLAFFAIAAVPGRAIAGTFKCESRSLSPDDEGSLRAKARAVLPKPARIEVLAPCRNPNSAHAWISTRRTTTSEGVQQWWEFSCQRETLIWGCDPPEFKQFYEMQLRVDDQLRDIELNFDKNTPLSEAQSQASKALALYVDPSVRLAECDSGSLKDSEWIKTRERNPLPRNDKSIKVTVSLDAGAHSVMLDDIDVEIRFPVEGIDRGACWAEWVIVT
jgi:hypothetical protein